MRHLQHAFSSFPSHLFTRKSIYYFRASIPNDLKHYFPITEIKRSLKTTESRVAKVMAVSLEYQLQQTFMMLRTGMLPDDMAVKVVEQLVPAFKQKPVDPPKINVLSAIIEKYIAAKQGEWTEKTKMEVSCVVKLLQDVLGDVDVTAITRPMVLDLRTTLQKLPTNMYKKYSGQSISQVIAKGDKSTLSTKSVNKHITRLGAILRYCVDEGVLLSNPAHGLKVSEKKRVDQERGVYSNADIRNIFRLLPKNDACPERYWIPLIGLYSGMRLNEICQLYVEDVINFENIWCISINNEKDKRIKNSASERVIPIHLDLIKLGFLEYVESVKRSNAERLWPNLEWTDLTGYGNSFCKWYQRFNRLNITDDPKKVFHSFRHTVADTLKQVGVPEVVISEILGHTHSSITTGRYGKRYQPRVLLDALMKLDYGVNI